jgi:hypothetical protein
VGKPIDEWCLDVAFLAVGELPFLLSWPGVLTHLSILAISLVQFVGLHPASGRSSREPRQSGWQCSCRERKRHNLLNCWSLCLGATDSGSHGSLVLMAQVLVLARQDSLSGFTHFGSLSVRWRQILRHGQLAGLVRVGHLMSP